jgi:hypothetical protein
MKCNSRDCAKALEGNGGEVMDWGKRLKGIMGITAARSILLALPWNFVQYEYR